MLLCLPLLLASCGAKKSLIQDNSATGASGGVGGTQSAAAQSLSFVQKVSDRKVYSQNIVADMTFTAKMGDKDITVPGSVHMRKDKVIRLQLFIPILGSEVGRLEFTPDYVLVVDRMHKQYIKADYNQLDFLKNNGLTFYSLQALFWNQLLLPGVKSVSESDLRKFTVNLDEMGSNLPISLTQGNMSYLWQADRTSGQINKAEVTYSSAEHGSSNLLWNYSNFKALGSKQYPANHEITFTTTATEKRQTGTIILEMKDLTMASDWEEQTTVSDRYKQMDAQDVLGKLLKF